MRFEHLVIILSLACFAGLLILSIFHKPEPVPYSGSGWHDQSQPEWFKQNNGAR